MYTEMGLHAQAVEEMILKAYRKPLVPACGQCGLPNKHYGFYDTCHLCRLLGGSE